MIARLAADTFGTEPLISLIRWYKMHPGSTMTGASRDLGLSLTTCSKHTADLRDAGVLIVDQREEDKRGYTITVDQQRVRVLLRALSDYVAGKALPDDDAS
jgi:DNA-binding MarR family transcriptional regulator